MSAAPKTGSITSQLLRLSVAGEALLVTPGMAARRVTIRAARGGQPSVLTKGDAILVTPVGPAHHGQAGGETLGPITALAIGR